MQTVEKPVTIERDRNETVTTHPAFAQIAASRVSGHAHLYDSDFSHQHYINVTIRRSQLHRTLSRDWAFGTEDLITVAMSEAQWATFVSSMNMGSGTPCTLQREGGKSIPSLPPAESVDHQFKHEVRATLLHISEELKKCVSGIDGPLGKGSAKELRAQIEHLSFALVDSTSFVSTRFDEHVEETVEKAKVEINAYVGNAVARAGLEALSGGRAVIEFNPQRDIEG